MSKKTYYQNILRNSSHSKIWKMINSLFGRGKRDNEIRLMVNGALTSNKSAACDVLNEYFTTIGRKLADDIPRQGRQDPCI